MRIKGYVVLNRNEEVISIGNGSECRRLADRLNHSDQCAGRPYKATYVDKTFD